MTICFSMVDFDFFFFFFFFGETVRTRLIWLGKICQNIGKHAHQYGILYVINVDFALSWNANHTERKKTTLKDKQKCRSVDCNLLPSKSVE